MEWGSVPDWLAGVGGLLSIAATGYIAISERRRADHMEDRTDELEYVKRNAVIDEGSRLAGAAITRANNYIQLATLNGGNSGHSQRGVIDDLAEVSKQVGLLQQFPGNDPRLFVSLGALAIACKLPEDGNDIHSGWLQARCRSLVETVTSCRNGLLSLR